MESEAKTKAVIWIVGIILGLLVSIVLSPFTIVNAGHRTVVYRFGTINRVLTEGIHYKTPLIESVDEVDIRTQKIEVTAMAYSKDTQTIDSTLALQYHLQPDALAELYREVGAEYQSTLIDPALQEAVKAAIAKFTANELLEQRPKVRDEIKMQIAERLKERYIVVDDFSIVNFDFSDEYENSVEQKQVAQQNALKAKNDLERVKFEADQRVASATAEAEAIRIQAQAITQQGGAEYVRMKAVEKWNGVLPVQMIPNASVPFIDLSK
jgi:regulator of protease activity HflC (stomatin/prohibitin superfamily)